MNMQSGILLILNHSSYDIMNEIRQGGELF